MEKESITNKKWRPKHKWIKSVRVDLKNKTLEKEYYTPKSPEEEKQLWDDYNEKMQETVEYVLEHDSEENKKYPPLSDEEYRYISRKGKFTRTYSNLPLVLRQDTILVLDKYGPITWNVAFTEVEAKTPIGEEILKKLEKLKII